MRKIFSFSSWAAAGPSNRSQGKTLTRMMSVRKRCENKKAYKHTGGHSPSHPHVPRTLLDAAPGSQLHHQCAAKLPHYRCPRSGGARRPNSAHCLQTPHGGKAPHRACSVPAPQISRQQVPWFLDQPSRKGFLALANTGKQQKENNTEWNVEHRRETNRLADLNYTIRGHVIQEALKVEDENAWKHLNVHLLARLT